MKKSKKKSSPCLVTGGAGFIGAHVTEHLLKMGRDVTVLDDLSGELRRQHPAWSFVRQSDRFLDYELIDSLFRSTKFQDVYHLAAYAAEGLSHFIKRFNYNNNVDWHG